MRSGNNYKRDPKAGHTGSNPVPVIKIDFSKNFCYNIYYDGKNRNRN